MDSVEKAKSNARTATAIENSTASDISSGSNSDFASSESVLTASKQQQTECYLSHWEKTMKLFYAKLQYVHLTPRRTHDRILKEHEGLQKSQNSHLDSVLRRILSSYDVSKDITERICP